jgi:hypothetical protein
VHEKERKGNAGAKPFDVVLDVQALDMAATAQSVR